MKSIGVVSTLMLGFLGVVVGVLFSVIMLKEKPSIKSIILAIIVSGLVGVGLYLG
jgi:drug/metabolite transporter (DMT)-like permease